MGEGRGQERGRSVDVDTEWTFISLDRVPNRVTVRSDLYRCQIYHRLRDVERIVQGNCVREYSAFPDS